MRQPSDGFKILLGYCCLLVFIIGADQAAAPVPAAESQFIERLLEMQIRWLEASTFMPVQNQDESPSTPPVQNKRSPQQEALTTVAAEAGTLALDENTSNKVREQAATIWWIFVGSRQEISKTHQLEQLLPPPENQGDLSHILVNLKAQKPIENESLAVLREMGISRWLKSRLRAHIVENGAMPGPDGPHAKSEIENLGNMAFLVTMYFLFGLAGFAILVGWRFISARIPNVGARQHTESPFAPEAWVGAYVVLAWFAFFITSQLLFSILFGNIGSGGVMSVMALGIQCAHGFFALWAIGQLGMDGPRETIAGVLEQLKIGLEPYGGRIRHVMAWGLGGYAVAIPLVVIAAILQAWLLPIESNLVSNPILPLLTDPPDVITQVLLIIAVVFAAPFFEECLFRGFLFRQLRNRMGVAPAVLITSAVFAAVHFDVGTFLHLFVLGGVLALVTERSGGLLAAMLVHGFWNGATILMTVSVFGS